MANCKIKILIVDDSEMVRNFHSYIVKMFGYEAVTAENGAVALEKLLSQKIDLLITDINMPKMDGYELIKNANEKGFHIPVIIISTEEEYKPELINVKLHRIIHLTKPTNPERLIKTVKAFLQS